MSNVPPPAGPADPGGAGGDIDLDQTDRVAELAAIPVGDRDAGWAVDFLNAIPTAALEVPPEEMMRGPDGFSYLLMRVPGKDEEFNGLSVKAVAPLCMQKGIGIAIYPESRERTVWVFTYGNLWSYVSTGSFDKRPTSQGPIPPPPTLKELSNQVMVGAPSEAAFPPAARNVVREFLTMNGVGTPRAALVTDPAGREAQSLLLNVYVEDFKSQEHFQAVMQRLTWYFPPHYRLRPLVQRGTKVDELLEPF